GSRLGHWVTSDPTPLEDGLYRVGLDFTGCKARKVGVGLAFTVWDGPHWWDNASAHAQTRPGQPPGPPGGNRTGGPGPNHPAVGKTPPGNGWGLGLVYYLPGHGLSGWTKWEVPPPEHGRPGPLHRGVP